MRAFVIGYGSMGARHARILKSLGHSVSVISKREIDFLPSYRFIEDAFHCEVPDYIVIANATAEHDKSLTTLCRLGFAGTVLVEKPLFARPVQIPALPFEYTFVGYNLRFHPMLEKLKDELRDQDIAAVTVQAGQFLPSWRPSRDYRLSYSASREQGGGVLRDLSHELDYLGWLLGEWIDLAAVGGKFSDLEIDSDDLFHVLIRFERCAAVTLQVNYLDKIGRREMTVHTKQNSYHLDLVRGLMNKNGECSEFAVPRDETYAKQHGAAITKSFGALCTFVEGLGVVDMIEAIEVASREMKWVRSNAIKEVHARS